jgi:predicted enzyme related to lactoylglutathione lyase
MSCFWLLKKEKMQKEPTFGHGKICYIEIPAKDPQASADFFEKVFGWHIRRDDGGHLSFDDGVGEVSGMWITDREPVSSPGLMISIMVDDAVVTSEAIAANGGEILRPVGFQPEKVAVFKDPGGNIWSIYQHGG